MDHIIHWNDFQGVNFVKLYAIDWIAGSFGGAALTIAGHPFELQSDRQEKSMMNCMRNCYKYEGLTGFYKGMGFPLASVSLVNAVVFSTNEASKIIFGFRKENNLIEGCITGAFAGLVNTIVVTPVDLVKSRLQVQKDSKENSYYKGIIDCLVKTYKQSGIRGLYKGNLITIFREIPAYGAQFGSYYCSKNIICKFKGIEQKDLSNFWLMTAGAISGIFCWSTSFPQDVIKTNLQLDINGSKFNNHKYFKDGGIIDCTKFIWKTEGFRGFWTGFLPQIIQAILGNAALFLTYEKMKKYLLQK